ncbi:MAG: response regulator [Actinomycetota bacterium]|nr:response regulator [Actinomycetota bacterium]
MHILVATDADYVVNDVTNALGAPDVSFTIVREGREVSRVVAERTPDLAILDLQVGSKGGMAITMDLRLDASSGNAPDVKVLMLLDREADVHLARRSAANAWLVKPFDPLALKRAVRDVLAEPVTELPESVAETDDDTADEPETVEEEAPVAG